MAFFSRRAVERQTLSSSVFFLPCALTAAGGEPSSCLPCSCFWAVYGDTLGWREGDSAAARLEVVGGGWSGSCGCRAGERGTGSGENTQWLYRNALGVRAQTRPPCRRREGRDFCLGPERAPAALPARPVFARLPGRSGCPGGGQARLLRLLLAV